MSRAGEQAFATLSQYFMQRLNARTDAEFRTKAMAEDRAARKEDWAEERKAREEQWRTEQAAKGETRTREKRMVGDKDFEMEVGKYFDPKTGKYEERIYGARPAVSAGGDWKVNASGLAYRTAGDGQIQYDTTNQRQPSGGGKASAPKEPKRIWVDRGGESMLLPEAEVQKGDRPLDNSAAGRKRAEGREAVAGAWRAIGDVAAAPVRAVGSMLGLGGKSGAAPAQPAGPSLDQQAAATLQNASQRIAENPSARAAIEAQLKAAGYDELIPLLPKG